MPSCPDVHITQDDVIIMFHDPSLERTTNGTGLIREQAYYGNIEHVVTVKEPVQKIPTFQELTDFLMREEHKHVKINIDIKPDNDPDRLFRLMRKIVTQYDNFEQDLSPRIILGLWHPKFLRAALEHVPELRRIHIGASPELARKYFWDQCDGFSMYFASLVPAEGQAFLQEAQAAGKDVFVWTVNRTDEMIEATRWGVKAVLTDNTDQFRNLRVEMAKDFNSTRSDNVGIFFRWATWRYWALAQLILRNMWISQLEKRAGESFKDADEKNLRAAATEALEAANLRAAASVGGGSGATTAVGSPEVKPMVDQIVPPPMTTGPASIAATA